MLETGYTQKTSHLRLYTMTRAHATGQSQTKRHDQRCDTTVISRLAYLNTTKTVHGMTEHCLSYGGVRRVERDEQEEHKRR